MRDQPWRDICSLEDWGQLLDDYQRGQMTSKGKTAGHKIAHFFGRNVLIRKLFHLKGTMALPDGIVALDQQIRAYHDLKKPSLRHLAQRAQMLRTIASTGQRFIAQHKVLDKSVLKNSIRRRIFNEDDADEEYTRQKKRSLDYAVSKIVRRAGRKAEYIDTLRQHVINADHGFRIAAKLDFLAYIKGRAKQPLDDDLLNMQADVIVEKLDPWHRDWEMSIDPKKQLGVTGNTVHGKIVFSWIRDASAPGVPFFVWLEGHELCTAAGNREEKSVSYHRGDQGEIAGIELLSPLNGSLWMCRFGDAGNTLFDTSAYKGKPMSAVTSAAYVWTSDGLILAGQHEGGHFHHSSFVSGRRVRCSGMIRVNGGKVTRVDSDSGHYKPKTRHLRNFVEFLNLYNVFAPNAVVVDKAVSRHGLGVQEFLDGGDEFIEESVAQRMVRIRRDWQRFSSKAVSLAGIVEERFQIMRSKIGPIPSDEVLWTRAYKAVCYDFGEVDRRYLRKANSPPIPRTAARDAARQAV